MKINMMKLIITLQACILWKTFLWRVDKNKFWPLGVYENINNVREVKHALSKVAVGHSLESSYEKTECDEDHKLCNFNGRKVIKTLASRLVWLSFRFSWEQQLNLRTLVSLPSIFRITYVRQPPTQSHSEKTFVVISRVVVGAKREQRLYSIAAAVVSSAPIRWRKRFHYASASHGRRPTSVKPYLTKPSQKCAGF